jgi:pimeloyl-ACP methyl ester carboxylesterase
LISDLLAMNLPAFERALKEEQKTLPADVSALPETAQLPPITLAIMRGVRKYTEIRVPILAIYAARDEASVNAQVKAFESGVPSARVVRLANANHFVFLSNEDDVLREMNAFLDGLR